MTPNAPRREFSGLLSLIYPAALIAVATACVPALAATVISYPNFSDVSGLTINGNAAQVGSALRVTPATFSQAGSVFSTNKVSLTSGASFSTYFTFRFTSPGGSCDGLGCGADGIVFTVQTLANNVGGAGGGIGYFGIPNSLGVEFDNWWNPQVGDIDSNHLGIDLNGSVNSVSQIAINEADLNGGDVWSAWVDYNSATDQLEVRTTRSAVRPAAPCCNHRGPGNGAWLDRRIRRLYVRHRGRVRQPRHSLLAAERQLQSHQSSAGAGESVAARFCPARLRGGLATQEVEPPVRLPTVPLRFPRSEPLLYFPETSPAAEARAHHRARDGGAA